MKIVDSCVGTNSHLPNEYISPVSEKPKTSLRVSQRITINGCPWIFPYQQGHDMLPVSIVESVEIEDWREDYLLTWTNRKFVAASLTVYTTAESRTRLWPKRLSPKRLLLPYNACYIHEYSGSTLILVSRPTYPRQSRYSLCFVA